MAEITVKAILAVADLAQKNVNFELINMEGKVGGRLEVAVVVNGVVIDKTMTHPQMPKELKEVKLAILTCPFESPKSKSSTVSKN